MVCDKCEKKLGKVITPDPWKSGARNTTEGGGRKLNENKALTSTKNRFNPYTPKFEGQSVFFSLSSFFPIFPLHLCPHRDKILKLSNITNNQLFEYNLSFMFLVI